MVSPNANETSLEKQLDPYVRKQNAKLVQVIQNFFTKAVQVISLARSDDDSDRHNDSRINRWFNLLLPSSDLYKDELKLWKLCTDLANVPPLIIETYIDLRQLSDRTAIVLKDENENAWTVAKSGSKKQEVVIERWLIEFDPHEVSGSIIDELPLIYKQAIILFRSLFGYLRLMPAYKLKQNLNKDKSNRIIIGNKVLDGKQPISSKGRIGLSKSIIPHQMLTADSHLVQRQFQPIQTTLGTLKVSVAYRRHYDFCVHDSEEVLSTHFINSDKQKQLVHESSESNHESQNLEKELSLNNEQEHHVDAEFRPLCKPQRYSSASMSVSPNSSGIKENSPSSKKSNNTPPVSKASFQPFKVGSISTSPPPSNQTYGASSLERRISITSNKSASNASLAALLRNPRGSNSSTTGSANIPINNASIHTSSFPRSISSSHGSNLAHDNDSPVPESVNNTPRFSSSFGSRASRRFSNTSIRQSLLHTNSINDQNSLLGTSAGLASSVNPLSGIYIDDDISDFVRMIDSKSDLRFNNANDSKLNVGSNSQLEVLSKFQSLRLHHQHLSDSVNQSLILQATPPPPLSATGMISSGHGSSPSRASSRKSSHSIYSASAGSYEPPLPTISSRLEKDSHKKIISSSADATVKPAPKKDVVGLSTTPSTYKRRSIRYENVFEDDDGEDYFLQLKDQNKPASAPLPPRNDEDEDDDLLFTMSDMNLAKN